MASSSFMLAVLGCILLWCLWCGSKASTLAYNIQCLWDEQCCLVGLWEVRMKTGLRWSSVHLSSGSRLALRSPVRAPRWWGGWGHAGASFVTPPFPFEQGRCSCGELWRCCSEPGEQPLLFGVSFWQAGVVQVGTKTAFLLQLEHRGGVGLGNGDVHVSLPVFCCLVVGCSFSQIARLL